MDDLIAPIYTRYTNPTTTILFNNTEVELHFTASAPSDAEAEALLDEVVGQVEEVLGVNVFSHRGETLEQIVGLRLTLKGYTIATAESCTGGLLSKRLTDVPAARSIFWKASLPTPTRPKPACWVFRPNSLPNTARSAPKSPKPWQLASRRAPERRLALGLRALPAPMAGRMKSRSGWSMSASPATSS
ncbi:CinA family protein [Chloracidobacterium thermophilum]|nr:CinA family protein [Chloracidobacterium thermophilum]